MRYELQRNLEQFQATGNPIYAWWAYRRARQLGEPIPAPVLEYLDSISETVLQIAAGPPADPQKRPVELARGMKLHISKPFNDYRRNQKHARFISLMEDSLLAWIDKYGEKRGWADSELKGLAKRAGIGKTTADNLMKDFLERDRTIANTHLSGTSKD